VIAGGFTFYALGDMMLYNRRKRAEFYQEQKALKENAIQSARLAIASGEASEEQIKFIQREDEHDTQLTAAAKAKAGKKGIFKTGKEWLFSGLKNEEEGEDVGTSERRLWYEALSEEDDSLGERESDIVRAIEEKKMAIAAKAKQAFADEKERQRSGGPLDRLGIESDGEAPKSGGLSSWISRR
jgi:Cytochrome oxidase c assembly